MPIDKRIFLKPCDPPTSPAVYARAPMSFKRRRSRTLRPAISLPNKQIVMARWKREWLRKRSNKELLIVALGYITMGKDVATRLTLTDVLFDEGMLHLRYGTSGELIKAHPSFIAALELYFRKYWRGDTYPFKNGRRPGRIRALFGHTHRDLRLVPITKEL